MYYAPHIHAQDAAICALFLIIVAVISGYYDYKRERKEDEVRRTRK